MGKLSVCQLGHDRAPLLFSLNACLLKYSGHQLALAFG